MLDRWLPIDRRRPDYEEADRAWRVVNVSMIAALAVFVAAFVVPITVALTVTNWR